MKVGRYELESELGRGGMGVVHRARADDGRTLAIKVLSRTADADERARFAREVRLLASFSEAEGFVPIVDQGEDVEGDLWFAMPLVPGGTLARRLAKGPLPIMESIALVRTLATTVGRAHERGVAHRDLKPANVLFTADERPLVSDLGLAKHYKLNVLGATRSEILTETGTFAGTSGYASPEQLEDSKKAGPPADVFALGAILYETIAGARPFPGDGVMSYVKALAGTPPPLSSRRPGVPRGLDAVVARALAKAPAERYPDGHALARALAPFAKEEARAGGRSGLLLALLATAGLLVLGYGLVRSTPPLAPPVPPVPPPPASQPRPPGPTQPAAPPVAKLSAKQLYDRASARGDAGDRAGALEDFTASLDLDPTNAAAWASRALIHLKREDVGSAIADAEHAIALAPRLPEAWLTRGAARCKLSQWTQAIGDLSECVKLTPKEIQAWRLLGNAHMQTGSHEAGLAALSIVLEIDQRDAKDWNTRALVRQLTGDLVGAEKDCAEAILRAPGDGQLRVNRAVIRERRRDLAGAHEDLSKAIELDPRISQAWMLRGRVREDMKDRAGAKADYRRAIELAPDLTPGARERLRTLENDGD